MGANATTSVPSYVAGEVLTAADLNVTNSGIPVFNNATDRTNAFGGTGEKVLAEGQYAYLESDDKTYVYDGSAWKEVGSAGLVLISSTTIGSAVSSITVSNAFSSSYDSYKVIVSGGAASTGMYLLLQLGSTTSGYYTGGVTAGYGGSAPGADSQSNGSSARVGVANTSVLLANFELLGPNLAKRTIIGTHRLGIANTGDQSYEWGGFENSDTQHTAFTILTSTGNVTGGTIKVYGYAN